MEIKKFKLLWLDKKEETVEGYSIADAFMKAGYSAGAMAALDTWYEFQKEKKPT
jgi:hypothetical protein